MMLAVIVNFALLDLQLCAPKILTELVLGPSPVHKISGAVYKYSLLSSVKRMGIQSLV